MFKRKKTSEDRLERVFRECREESERAYANSLEIFDVLKETLAASKSEIRLGINAIQRLSINDRSLMNVSETLKDQLRKIETSLEEDADNILDDLRIKRQHDDTFNITLFGRTMVGKSTLMSILTHANEEAIGKGAQRTTRDVREYRWKGMCVTDVPGIDAYGGEEDERVAEMAAKNADLIIFMISSGQPESTEADWLIKLKKEDKAIICLCNFKMGLPILRIKLKNKPALMAEMDLSGLKKQFNEFLRTGLQNEHIEIHVSFLLAELMASKPEFKDIQKDLHEVSQFAEFTKAVEAQVSSRGVFYRRKSYLALIDAPIYQHYRDLMRFTNDTYAAWLNAHKKQGEFQRWQRDFNSTEKELLKSRISDLYNQLKKSVSNFVETNVERSDVNERWERHRAGFNIETKVREALEMSRSRCEQKIKEMFNDLGKDLNMVNNLSSSFGKITGDGDITNWRRINGWASAIAGAGAAVGFILLNSNPIGWIFTGVSLLFGLFSWFSDSRESKRRDARQKMYKSLMESLETAEGKTMGKVLKIFDDIICSEIQKNAYIRLCVLQKTLLTVLNVERRCAMEYSEQHANINKMLVEYILKADRLNPGNTNVRIEKVARIPGKRIILITPARLDERTKRFISSWMGSNEVVETINLRTDFDISSQVSYLANRYTPDVTYKVKEIRSGELVIYAPKRFYTPEDIDGMDIIQQILNIPIILSNNESTI